MDGVAVEPGSVADADAVADLWVELARGQRDHGSTLTAAPNRTAARDDAARHAVTGGLFVARAAEADRSADTEADAAGDADAEGGGDTDRDDDADVGADDVDVEGAPVVVGFVTCGPESEGYDQDVDCGVVENLYVRPAYRGSGVGAELLSRAEESLAADGADVVTLEAMADNGGARRFYERHGYGEHRVEYRKPVGTESAENDTD
ncbi:GNAT family N-acetyltransferase [Halobaculum sp. D14]|uniref:GNAT family N-acetyltransferase n=1 Tax=unclassified Halobaculum TaxID=2640896 RepID=UPI003EBDF3F6